jgi:hypothetical protein
VSKIQYDKKQLPQVIVLGVLSLGLFGYFGFRMLTPPPSEAAPQGTKAALTAKAETTATATVAAASTDAAAPVAGVIDAPPVANVRDPFVAPVNDLAPLPVATNPTSPAAPPPLPVVRNVASLPAFNTIKPLPTARVPSAPPLNNFNNVNALPSAPPVDLGPSGWTVTGVIGDDTDPSSRIACMRNGDLHRYVRSGGTVDGDFQVVSVNRDGVVLRRSGHVYRLRIGQTVGAPTAGTQALPAATPSDKPSPGVSIRRPEVPAA